MIKLDNSHKNLIKANSSELPKQKFLSKSGLRMFDFQKFHKFLIQLLISPVSNLVPDMPYCIDLSQRKHFLFLKLIKIFIYARSFDDISLFIIFIFMIIIFNMLSFLKIIIVQIPNSMTKLTLMTIVNTKPSKEESTKGFFLIWIFLHIF